MTFQWYSCGINSGKKKCCEIMNIIVDINLNILFFKNIRLRWNDTEINLNIHVM